MVIMPVRTLFLFPITTVLNANADMGAGNARDACYLEES